MRKNEKLQNEIHLAISRDQLLNIPEPVSFTRAGKHMKTFIYLVLFTGLGIGLNSCVGGYVASEPAYVEYSRPQRLHENQIWITGDWGWNYQTRVYVQKTGYWANPRQGQSYVAGYWNTTPHGKTWSKGHWQRDNRRNNSRHNK